VVSTDTYPGPRPDRATAQRKREAALTRLIRVRGVVIIAAGTLTAAVAGLVSAASGRTLGAKHAVRTSVPIAKVSPRAGTAATMPPLASAGQLGLGGPSSAPQAAPPPAQSDPNAQAAAQAQAQAAAQAQAQQSVPAPAVSGGS
jgi:hypothetical protein